ncbi:tRNA (N6-isopentenyl adenosine(37)-C2)-methylthiotransferase MiaB [Desulfonema magnum]|uniref:tRNA-2-methylthio-N(6)-dimethylallyladenosine synthase n=1 Tax=Desulfonema magnum TaxID=45655 RepID=A0A975GSQ4_9BACT|nr:tRNA (N6-isopentenyl adenosine(37)-C2)-methylthiotransferase MiaB [Desulfonema magnum]QTA92294.1 tRNA-2-methylthio-N(6)-dimethylallyladenosine synthase [Desulfonema magnum]
MTKNLYIHTIGCQMNVYDAEQMAGGLMPLGYQLVSSPEMADLILVNTCAIREKAEQKVFSFLGRLAKLKKKKPGLIIGVGGCVAQQEGKKILERVPYIDVVFGTHAVGRLPKIIQQIESDRGRIIDIEMSDEIQEREFAMTSQHEGKVTSFVTIIQGCDNYCTYCVVPYVRGREMSRSPENIIQEIRQLVKAGVREVTLLGQNVNSYGKKEGLCSFSELLSQVNDIEGLLRIRFTTSHPKDLSEELIHAFRRLDKLCKHIHLPVQSGSNRVLKRMNRKYTRELYLEKVEKLRDVCPDIAITSDMIVGFPGETRADFEDTLNLIRTVEYDSLFAFKYSDRPNASAARFSDKLSEQEKKERLQILLDLQKHFTIKKNEDLVGKTEEILVDGLSKRQTSSESRQISLNPESDIQWAGRTSANKIVNFIQGNDCRSNDKILTGQLIRVRIDKALSHSLWGEPVKLEPLGSEGEKSYAA